MSLGQTALTLLDKGKWVIYGTAAAAVAARIYDHVRKTYGTTKAVELLNDPKLVEARENLHRTMRRLGVKIPSDPAP